MIALTAAAGRADDLTTLSGRKTAGRVVAVAEAAVSVRTADGRVEQVPTRELAAVEISRGPALPADARFDEIELTDGSVLKVGKVAVVGAEARVEPLTPAVAIKLPLGAVAWWRRNAHEPKSRDEWSRLLANRGKRDLFVVRQAAGLNPLPGTVVEGTPAGDRVVFEREDGQRVSLPLARATGGLVLNPPPRASVPPAVCRVLDAAGNAWAAAGVEFTADSVRVTTPAGAVADFPDRSAIRSLDFGRGNVLYLSDLALDVDLPTAEKSGPLGDQFPYSPRVGRDGELKLRGRSFPKGLRLPPDAIVSLAVESGFRTFRAVIGLPDGAPPDAAFQLRVEADGRVLFDAPVRAGEPPRDLSLNVADAARLRLSVTRLALWAGDGVILGDARLQK
jgi:hypothetical protein